jgi:Flp pilus assembly protein TadB
MLELIMILAAVSVFLLFLGFATPKESARKTIDITKMRELRARSIGNNKFLAPMAEIGARRAMKMDEQNAKYLRQLKQANWFWAKGEPMMPSPKAPFWNLETLWTEKIVGAGLMGGLIAIAILILGITLSFTAKLPLIFFILGAVVLGGLFGIFGYTNPDQSVAGAAAARQREISLEMGYRIPELRADVMGGSTIQRAMRSLSKRPGGPFVDELRRAVLVLDITKDDTMAMDQLMERNFGNELLTEFANSVKMVSRQGGQIGPVLNVLAELAQQRLRLQITSQARKNLQEMTRPIGLSNLFVMSLLIITPAIASVLASISR